MRAVQFLVERVDEVLAAAGAGKLVGGRQLLQLGILICQRLQQTQGSIGDHGQRYGHAQGQQNDPQRLLQPGAMSASS